MIAGDPGVEALRARFFSSRVGTGRTHSAFVSLQREAGGIRLDSTSRPIPGTRDGILRAPRGLIC